MSITQEQELKMLQELKHADHEKYQQILNCLISENLPVIENAARDFAGHGPEKHLLHLAGIKGFVCAAERYNDKTGTSFQSYALWYVKQYMRKLIAEYKNNPENLQNGGAR